MPGHRELLPVLWEMGILPDVYVMDGSPVDTSLTREDAIMVAMQGTWLPPEDQDRARSLIEANFDKLYEEICEGLRPLWPIQSHDILITWETRLEPQIH